MKSPKQDFVHRVAQKLTNSWSTPRQLPNPWEVAGVFLAVVLWQHPTQVEVMAYFSDGVDKLQAAVDSNGGRGLPVPNELLLMGLKSSKTYCQVPSLQIHKVPWGKHAST